MTSSHNEKAPELLAASAPVNRKAAGDRPLVAAFVIAAVVALGGWFYLLGELLMMVYYWLFG